MTQPHNQHEWHHRQRIPDPTTHNNDEPDNVEWSEAETVYTPAVEQIADDYSWSDFW